MDKIRLCVYGDSIAAGIGVDNPLLAWDNLIGNNYKNIEVLNHGVGGDTSKKGLDRIYDVVKDEPYITTIQFGMNDHCIDDNGEFLVNINEFENNLISMIDKLYKINSSIILITNHRVIEGDLVEYYYSRHPKDKYQKYGGANALIERYNKVIRKLSKDYMTKLVDMYKISKEYNPYMFLRSKANSEFDDGVHLHKLGAYVYFCNISEAIEDILNVEEYK